MTFDGTLIQCQGCLKSGKKQYLARILPDGKLLVLRFHHGSTIIQSQGTMFVSCGCGEMMQITNGTISLQQSS